MPHHPAFMRPLVFLLCVLTLAAFVPDASAQRRRPPGNQPPPAQQQNQPGQQGQPAADGPNWDLLEPSPYVTRERPKRWTVKLDMRIGAHQQINPNGQIEFDQWEFDAATLVFPAVSETASSVLEVRGPTDNEVPAIDGVVELADRPISDEMTVLKQGIGGGLLPHGTWRAQWQVPPLENGRYSARELEFMVSIAQSCYRVKFDERGASEVEWPEGPWPPEAAATFQPQMFVDFDQSGRGYDMSIITTLLNSWSEGRSVEEMRDQAKPVMLAKWLAGQTAQHVQISGKGLAYDKTGLWQGFDTAGAAAAAADGRGTEIDLPCLLVAIYRAVGLPARLVIGLDEEAEGKQIYLDDADGDSAIRVWVEFALYDEKNETFSWVPVDVTAIRKNASRLPSNYLSRPLRYFGTHDDLDHIAPLAFHFHPPTSVRAYGSPAMWGWLITPRPPARAAQQVRFDMTTTPRGGANQSRLPAEKD